MRSKVGRAVSHPHAIRVSVREGRVSLSGPVLAHEVDDLLSCVSAVRGVEEVENRLEVHQQAGTVPGLQGVRERQGNRFELMQSNWSPTARLLTIAAGSALMGYCIKRRDALSESLGTLGFLLFLRGATNIELKRLVSVGSRRAFGTDPQRETGEDLMQKKTPIEGGTPSRDAAQSREAVRVASSR